MDALTDVAALPKSTVQEHGIEFIRGEAHDRPPPANTARCAPREFDSTAGSVAFNHRIGEGPFGDSRVFWLRAREARASLVFSVAAVAAEGAKRRPPQPIARHDEAYLPFADK